MSFTLTIAQSISNPGDYKVLLAGDGVPEETLCKIQFSKTLSADDSITDELVSALSRNIASHLKEVFSTKDERSQRQQINAARNEAKKIIQKLGARWQP